MSRLEDKSAHIDRLRKLKEDLINLTNAITNDKLKQKWLKHIEHVDDLTTAINRIS